MNRLQIKMRRAMKEDRTLSEEQRKNAREPITREEVEKGKFYLRLLDLGVVAGDLILFATTGRQIVSAVSNVTIASRVYVET